MKSVNKVASHVRAILRISAVGLLATGLASVASAADVPLDSPGGVADAGESVLDKVVVTAARRREESAQEVPIPVSVVSGELLEDTGAFNVNRLQNIVPTLQFYSTNPRNTAVNIRGLGQPYGLTNDGIESGVGFYVDGVLYARPASTTLDFIDVERVEVLRGPQGTLFGKNTTAGAILVTTRKPEFEAGTDVELSFGNYGYTQAKSSITGPLGEKVAARLSFSGTQRDGTLVNVTDGSRVNDLNNTGVRAQLLYVPTEGVDINLALDYSLQRPVGYAQVLAGVAPTYRGTPGYASSIYGIAANPSANPRRHFWGIITDLNYWPANVEPTREVKPFARLIDTNTPWRSGNEVGGAALNIDADIGGGTLTSTTAWRFWTWDPSNDRDYLGLDVGTLSQAPSKHRQLTQEVRWAGELSSKLGAVFGLYGFTQRLNTNPVHTEEVGEDYFRFVWNPSPGPNGNPNIAAYGPGGSVVDNYFAGQRSEITSQLETVSAAVFTQVDWSITDWLSVLPGLRYNYDKKEVDFKQRALNVPVIPAGSPAPLPTPAYTNQTALREDDDTNLSGNLTVSFDAGDAVNLYATYSTAFKSIGINLGGGPAIEVPPEDVRHIEIGVKTTPAEGVTLNGTAYNTDIEDFQTQVLVPGNARPVIASADKVRVRGVELDANAQLSEAFSLYAALAYTDGHYESFKNAPVPLELTGYTAPSGLPQVDASGKRLPGISKWAGSLGGEARTKVNFLGAPGDLFTGVDLFYRSEFSSSATPSEFLNIDGYELVNLRFGFRAEEDWSVYLWVRNVLDEEYFELLQAAPAGQGVGHYGAQLGDPRTFGLTLRGSF